MNLLIMYLILVMRKNLNSKYQKTLSHDFDLLKKEKNIYYI